MGEATEGIFSGGWPVLSAGASGEVVVTVVSLGPGRGGDDGSEKVFHACHPNIVQTNVNNNRE